MQGRYRREVNDLCGWLPRCKGKMR
jgi:hypothetical protein